MTNTHGKRSMWAKWPIHGGSEESLASSSAQVLHRFVQTERLVRLAQERPAAQMLQMPGDSWPITLVGGSLGQTWTPRTPLAWVGMCMLPNPEAYLAHVDLIRIIHADRS